MLEYKCSVYLSVYCTLPVFISTWRDTYCGKDTLWKPHTDTAVFH